MVSVTRDQLRREAEQMARLDVGYKRWPVFLPDGSFYFTAAECHSCGGTEDIAEFTTAKGTEPLCIECRGRFSEQLRSNPW